MQNESQNIEYKESWRDEYLKWICGFANAQGGRIYIGVNDQKEVIGLSDAKRLLEDIPNKIVNYLGIVEDVNLLMEGDKEYIEIVVSPSNMPIAYKGTYHYRSGSTKQELKGLALQQFEPHAQHPIHQTSCTTCTPNRGPITLESKACKCPYVLIDGMDRTHLGWLEIHTET